MSELPKGWVALPMGDLGVWRGGGTPSKSNFEFWTDGTIPWVSPKDMKRPYISDAMDNITEAAVSGSATQLIPENSVLMVTRSGILQHSFPVAVNTVPVAVNQDLKAVTPHDGIDTDFVLRQLQADAQIILNTCSKSGTTVDSLDTGRLQAHSFRLAPLSEQKRIVAKADGLTARTARARNDLDRIPTLIARYKQRLLALAFSGEFTASWRRETGTDRKSQNGLPFGWVLKSLGEISEIQGGIQVGKKRPATAELVEVPYLRVANVQRGWLNLDEIKVLSVTPMERDKLLLEDGDILMNEGGDRDKLGRGWIWKGQIPICIHQNHVFRVRLNDRTLPPEYVSHYANENGQKYFFDQGTQTTNLASVSKRRVAALPVPIPPIEEAIEIVRLIDVSFGWLDRMAADHSAATKLLPKLDAAILAKAFRGKLVQQDPSDEPARSLLDRILAERAAAPKIKRGRKTSSRKEPATMNRNLEEVLSEAADWLPGQEAFRRCGMLDSANSDTIEALYAELRVLEKAGRLDIEPVFDEQGRKLFDKLKLKVA